MRGSVSRRIAERLGAVPTGVAHTGWRLPGPLNAPIIDMKQS